jgi:glutamate synthase domain-containing protein 1
MCGIVAFWDRTGRYESTTGRIVLTMLEALGCRGPDSAGMAVIGPEPGPEQSEIWSIRVAGPTRLADLENLGLVIEPATSATLANSPAAAQFQFRPRPGITPDDLEQALGSHPGGPEILSLGHRLDLVKQVGTPLELESSYHVSRKTGPLAIGHTRMSTESRIDLSHSQPFWAHGIPDLATVHNGHVTNYHQLRRQYEQRGFRFFTDNDSEVIGVYLRDRIQHGQCLADALEQSVVDLDGAFNYLVASADGLGIVRDRFGFKPLMVAETPEFVAVATEEMALRRAIPGDYTVVEPDPGAALFYHFNERSATAA